MREVNGIKYSLHGCSQSQGCNWHSFSPSSAPLPSGRASTALSGLPGDVAPTVIPDGSEAPFQVRISAFVQSWSQQGKEAARGAQVGHLPQLCNSSLPISPLIRVNYPTTW